jgi:hypothetical protein
MEEISAYGINPYPIHPYTVRIYVISISSRLAGFDFKLDFTNLRGEFAGSLRLSKNQKKIFMSLKKLPSESERFFGRCM